MVLICTYQSLSSSVFAAEQNDARLLGQHDNKSNSQNKGRKQFLQTAIMFVPPEGGIVFFSHHTTNNFILETIVFL